MSIAGELARRIIARSTDFVGLVERTSNATWDDPRTPAWDRDKSDWLVKWMGGVAGWGPGAPYCAAFDGAIVASVLAEMQLPYRRFLDVWTAHVMTNVRILRRKKLLASKPEPGAVWLAQHGATDSGHAGVVIAESGGTFITTVEGNTSAGSTADANAQRQGDGIWIRQMPVTGRGTLRTQGFLTPAGILELIGPL